MEYNFREIEKKWQKRLGRREKPTKLRKMIRSKNFMY